MILYYNPEIRGLLSLWMLFICFSVLYSVMMLFLQKRYKLLLPMLAAFAACDVYWQYLNANSYYVDNYAPLYKIDLCPIWIIIVINAALTVAAAAINLHILKWQKHHISAVSIKESFDTLPSGICFYENGGRNYLVNDTMDRITQSLVGQHLYNGERLWHILQSKSSLVGDENKAIVSDGEKAYGFTRYANNVNGQALYEIIASDITDEVERNRQLEEKNAELEKLNRMLEEYNKNLAEIVREREILKSKAKIHDDMNVLMMSTVKNIEKYDKEEAQKLISRWKSNILELERDTEPYRKNPRETLEELADTLGIALNLTGEFPKENENVRLFITAVSECMTNALRHADAKTLYVQSDRYGAVITNDGRQPSEPVREGGGLSNLRKRAQKTGAQITMQSAPEFKLTILY
ncbi:MAG: hypothetical protein IKF64_03690 [Eubacterium sp.]|nr:hypothetical protein [Eubacterium sp.]